MFFAIVGSFSCSGRRSLTSSCVPKSGVKIGVNLVGNRKLSRAQVFRDSAQPYATVCLLMYLFTDVLVYCLLIYLFTYCLFIRILLAACVSMGPALLSSSSRA